MPLRQLRRLLQPHVLQRHLCLPAVQIVRVDTRVPVPEAVGMAVPERPQHLRMQDLWTLQDLST